MRRQQDTKEKELKINMLVKNLTSATISGVYGLSQVRLRTDGQMLSALCSAYQWPIGRNE